MQAQILLGELFNERGERTRALSHFKDLAASSLATNEERAVVAMKIDRLTGALGASVLPPDLRGASLYEGASIGLVPLHDLPRRWCSAMSVSPSRQRGGFAAKSSRRSPCPTPGCSRRAGLSMTAIRS